MLDLFILKTRNLLKHYPCRNLKILNVEKQTAANKTDADVVVITVGNKVENWKKAFIFDRHTDEDFIKSFVEDIKNEIPEKYSQLQITNVKEIAENILHNFSKKDISDTFYITKIPYRQLKINDKIFLNINNITYQKILALLSKIDTWPASISFQDLTNCMKRKEIVTLLLYLDMQREELN